MSEEQLRALMASNAAALEVQRKEAEKEMRKLRESQDRTDARMGETMKMLEEIRERQGPYYSEDSPVEQFFFNSLKAKPILKGIRFDMVCKKIRGPFQRGTYEFDLLLINDQHVFLIEVKDKAHDNDLYNLTKKKSWLFPEIYTPYQNHTLHLGLASFHFYDNLVTSALEQGVSILQRKGDVMEDLYPEGTLIKPTV